MTSFLSVDNSYNGQVLRLLTDVHGNPLSTQAQNVTDTPYDHVVRTIADLPAPGATHTLTTGSWAIAGSFAISNSIYVPPGVTCLIRGMGWDKVISKAGSGNIINVGGTAIIEDLALVGSRCIDMTVAAGKAYLRNCSLTSGSHAIQVTAGNTLDIQGGLWDSSAHGLYLNGNLSWLHVMGVQASAGVGSSFIGYNAGTVLSAILHGCQVTASTNAITWAAANIPTYGLLVSANHFTFSNAPYSGFTHNSARVNYKCNSYWDGGIGGLLPETAIVP